MLLDEYLQELQRLMPVLRRHRGRQISSQELRNRLQAIAETWLNDVRLNVPRHVQHTDNAASADELAGKIIEATFHSTRATKYLALFGGLRAAVIRLKVESAVALVNSAEVTRVGGSAVDLALEAFNPAIADSYRQVLLDLREKKRLSL